MYRTLILKSELTTSALYTYLSFSINFHIMGIVMLIKTSTQFMLNNIDIFVKHLHNFKKYIKHMN